MINIGGNIDMKVVVPNITFSKNKILRNSLLKQFPNSTFNDKGVRYIGEELIEFLKDAEAIIVGLEKIDANILKNLPKLKIISKYGVGIDNIDISTCIEKKIKIGWTKGLNSTSVAEIVLGFMLGLSRNLFLTSNQLKNGVWNKDGGIELSNKTVGIIGLGNIGIKIVEFLAPFKCKILVNDIENKTDLIIKNSLEEVTKEELYKRSDIITIHTPLTESTYNLFNSDVFNKMKKNSILINTARGGIINENDLMYALKNNLIFAAAIDVFDIEPPTNPEFSKLENLVCTPHIGGNSTEAVLKMGISAIDHLINYKSENSL